MPHRGYLAALASVGCVLALGGALLFVGRGGEAVPVAPLADEQTVGYVLNQMFTMQDAPYRVSLVSGCAGGSCLVTVSNEVDTACFRVGYEMLPRKYAVRLKTAQKVECPGLAG